MLGRGFKFHYVCSFLYGCGRFINGKVTSWIALHIVARLHDDTHSSIDIPRAGSASLRSLEQSSGSTMLVNQTPIDDALSSKSILFELDENFGDIQAQPSPRISGIDVLPDVVEADLNEIGGPLLDPIPENDRDADNTLVNEDIDEVEKSFFTIGDDDDHLPKHLSKYQQRVMNKTESTNSLENSTSFFAIYPHSSTKRRDATLAFYTCLNLTKNSFINMEQNEVYGDIRIWKKT